MGRSRQERKAYKKSQKKMKHEALYGKKIKTSKNNINPKIAKMCINKIRYLSYNSAVRNCLYYSKWGKPLKIYRCPNCNQWHLTSHVKS